MPIVTVNNYHYSFRSANSSTQDFDLLKPNCSRRGSHRRSGSYLDQASPGIRRLLDFTKKPANSLPMGSLKCAKRNNTLYNSFKKKSIHFQKRILLKKIPFHWIGQMLNTND